MKNGQPTTDPSKDKEPRKVEEVRHSTDVENANKFKVFMYGVVGAILASIIIALFAGWLNSQKQELKQDIIGSLTTKIDSSSNRIREELIKEKEARTLLAASLFKSGVDIPTSLLVGFSNIENDPSLKRLFSKEISSGTGITETLSAFEDFSSKFSAPGWVKYAAKLDNNAVIIAYSEKPPSDRGAFTNAKVQAYLENVAGGYSEVTFNVNQASDFIDVLQLDGVKTSNIIVVPASPSNNGANKTN